MNNCGSCMWFDGDNEDGDLRFCDLLECWKTKSSKCPHWKNKDNNKSEDQK